MHHADVHAALQAWRTLLGGSAVLVGEAIPARFTRDTSASRRRLGAVLQIASAGQLPEVMRIAARHRCKVHPVSTGRNWGYGSALPVEDDVVVLDLSALRGIEYDPTLGTVTVEPGVTQGMLARALAGEPYMVPTTGAGPEAGILSNALERGFGITPHADHFMALTDVEAVLADGSLYRSALREACSPELARLYKWNIGPYANGLFSQSGFGIVTRASFLLARRPEVVKACVFELHDDALLEPAVARIQSVLQMLPGIVGGLNLMNRHRVLAMTVPYPDARDRNGDGEGVMSAATVARLADGHRIQPWTALATLYGPAPVVSAAQRVLRTQLRGIARPRFLGPRTVDLLTGLARFLGARRLHNRLQVLQGAMPIFLGQPSEQVALPLAYWRHRKPPPETGLDPALDGCGVLWYAPLVPMRGDDVRRLLAFVTDVVTAHGLEPTITLTSQSERLFECTVALLYDLDDARASARAHACLAQLVEAGTGHGFYPYRLHVDAMAAHAARHPQSSALIHRLKQAWDPDDLIAPGRYR